MPGALAPAPSDRRGGGCVRHGRRHRAVKLHDREDAIPPAPSLRTHPGPCSAVSLFSPGSFGLTPPCSSRHGEGIPHHRHSEACRARVWPGARRQGRRTGCSHPPIINAVGQANASRTDGVAALSVRAHRFGMVGGGTSLAVRPLGVPRIGWDPPRVACGPPRRRGGTHGHLAASRGARSSGFTCAPHVVSAHSHWRANEAGCADAPAIAPSSSSRVRGTS